MVFLLNASPDGDSENSGGSDRLQLRAAAWNGRIQENPNPETILPLPTGAGARKPPLARNDASIAHHGISA
jgi:hypothetical protein